MIIYFIICPFDNILDILKWRVKMSVKFIYERDGLLYKQYLSTKNIKKVFFLDRNAISYAKRGVENISITLELQEKLNTLKLLDQPENMISCFLSVIEGNQKGNNDSEMRKENFRSEAETLRAFFKSARTDAMFLEKAGEEYQHIDLGRGELDFPARERFYLSLYPIIQLQPPQNLYEKAEDKILKLAKDNRLDPGSFLVLFAIATLYQNQTTRKLFKFKSGTPQPEHIYNVLSDIAMLARFYKMMLFVPHHCSTELYSFDKVLKEVMKLITLKSVAFASPTLINTDPEIIIDVKYSPDFFTAMPTDHLNVLRSKMNEMQSSQH